VNINRSIRHLMMIFLVFFVALSAGLVYWQAVVAQQVTSNTHLNFSRQCTSESAPLRGNIYDRRGVLLAYSVKSDLPGLCGWKRVYTPAAQGLESLIGYYISPLDSSTGIESQYNNYLTGQVGLTGLDNTFNDILHIPPQGDNIYLTVDSRIEKILLKTFSESAPVDNVNVFPTNRGSVLVSDPSTGEILGVVSEPTYDANCVINCSLNQLRLDFIAAGYNQTIGCEASCDASEFNFALDSTKAQEILQNQQILDTGSNCESNNDCNVVYLAFLNSDPAQPLTFRPTEDCYPPGSIYKTVTLMAAVDSGTFQLNDPVFYNDPTANPYPQHLQALGPVTVRSGDDTETWQPDIAHLQGFTFHYPVSLAYGYSHSDNIIYLQTGVQTGAATWLKYNENLYIDQKIPFDLPVKVSTVTPQSGQNLCSYNAQSATPMKVTDLAEDSFGQGTDFVTPLQMMLVDNTVADDGQLMRPAIIQKIVDPTNQAILQSFVPQLLRQVVSASTAQGIRDSMVGVVDCGSASFAPVQLIAPYSPWAIVGKTGTAQVSDATQPADAWFITQGPYVYQSDKVPPITVVAMKENGGDGAYNNGPMLRDIYNDIFTEIDTNVQQPAPEPADFCDTSGFLQNQ
jgi:penicillin-binding protein A